MGDDKWSFESQFINIVDACENDYSIKVGLAVVSSYIQWIKKNRGSLEAI